MRCSKFDKEWGYITPPQLIHNLFFKNLKGTDHLGNLSWKDASACHWPTATAWVRNDLASLGKWCSAMVESTEKATATQEERMIDVRRQHHGSSVRKVLRRPRLFSFKPRWRLESADGFQKNERKKRETPVFFSRLFDVVDSQKSLLLFTCMQKLGIG